MRLVFYNFALGKIPMREEFQSFSRKPQKAKFSEKRTVVPRGVGEVGVGQEEFKDFSYFTICQTHILCLSLGSCV